MALVAYSDSEGSDDETTSKITNKTLPKSVASGNFAVDKSNPTKIRVNLHDVSLPTSERPDGEPAPKRPCVGGGNFSGFNAMLPAPKRDNNHEKSQNGRNATHRKVFSLKTGAEPAFSRDSDAELRQLFTEDDYSTHNDDAETTVPSVIPKTLPTTEQTQSSSSKPFLFKPLSVARNSKKKKPVSGIAPRTKSVEQVVEKSAVQDQPVEQAAKKNISLFSSATDEDAAADIGEEDEDEIIEVLPDDEEGDEDAKMFSTNSTADNQPQSLDTIASDLNLSAADRRQLFGRSGTNSGKASHVLNFNTDTEYAANQAFLSTTDAQAQQHNPVRSIAPGKHSLKQLVASAQGQKEALEESFAMGKKNKKEAGSKYGW